MSEFFELDITSKRPFHFARTVTHSQTTGNPLRVVDGYDTYSKTGKYRIVTFHTNPDNDKEVAVLRDNKLKHIRRLHRSEWELVDKSTTIRDNNESREITKSNNL